MNDNMVIFKLTALLHRLKVAGFSWQYVPHKIYATGTDDVPRYAIRGMLTPMGMAYLMCVPYKKSSVARLD